MDLFYLIFLPLVALYEYSWNPHHWASFRVKTDILEPEININISFFAYFLLTKLENIKKKYIKPKYFYSSFPNESIYSINYFSSPSKVWPAKNTLIAKKLEFFPILKLNSWSCRGFVSSLSCLGLVSTQTHRSLVSSWSHLSLLSVLYPLCLILIFFSGFSLSCLVYLFIV